MFNNYLVENLDKNNRPVDFGPLHLLSRTFFMHGPAHHTPEAGCGMQSCSAGIQQPQCPAALPPSCSSGRSSPDCLALAKLMPIMLNRISASYHRRQTAFPPPSSAPSRLPAVISRPFYHSIPGLDSDSRLRAGLGKR